MQDNYRCGMPEADRCLLNQLADSERRGKHRNCQACGKTERDLDKELKAVGRMFAKSDPGFSKTDQASLEELETLAKQAVESPSPRQLSKSEATKRKHASNRFPVQRVLAETELAKISVAKDREVPREVALYELLPQFAYSTSNHVRFLREAKIAGMLEHSCVPPIYSVGRYDDGRPFYVTRLVNGETLQAAIDRLHSSETAIDAHAPALQKLLRQLISVCDAVTHAHGREVIHHNINPENVLLGDHGEVLLTQWNLATFKSDQKDAGVESSRAPKSVSQLIGSPVFMSPEQATEPLKKVTYKCDLFSLGAVLCDILTGHPPYDGSDPDLFERIGKGEIKLQPPLGLRRVPPPLESICLRAMHRVPNQRYDSATDFADDIQNWLSDRPVSAHDESFLSKCGRGIRNRLRFH